MLTDTNTSNTTRSRPTENSTASRAISGTMDEQRALQRKGRAITRIKMWMPWLSVLEYYGSNIQVTHKVIEGAPVQIIDHMVNFLVLIAVY